METKEKKGNQYEIKGDVLCVSDLMEKTTINDMGEPHKIGSWYRNFKIVKK